MKYQDGSKLMKDLPCLSISYNGVIPEDRWNDYLEFKDRLDNVTKKSSKDEKRFPSIIKLTFPSSSTILQWGMMQYFPSYLSQFPNFNSL